MKQILICIVGFLVNNLVLCGQCQNNNAFIGTIDSDWYNPKNWTQNCVPSSPIQGFINIESNCVLKGSESYIFALGSTLQILDGVIFANESEEELIIDGTMRGTGLYNGNMKLFGKLEPGNTIFHSDSSGRIAYHNQTYNIKLMPDNKWWMTENLNIGQMINIDDLALNNNKIEKYCYDNKLENCTKYGALYPFWEVMEHKWTNNVEGNKGICPNDWHVPTQKEWDVLISKTLETDIGSSLSAELSLWKDGKLVQSKDFGISGFNAFPTGFLILNNYHQIGEVTSFWSSTNLSSTTQVLFSIYYNDVNIHKQFNNESKIGYSVRCVMD